MKLRTLFRVRWLATVLLLLTSIALLPRGAIGADSKLIVEGRLADCVAYLTSDALGGRMEGTRGAACAAEFTAAQFGHCGLKTDWSNGTPLQRFPYAAKLKVRLPGELIFAAPGSDPASPQRTELKPETDFIPLTSGDFGLTDLPLVFAGYGITDPHYDDYSGIDVAGKAVILLCHKPRFDNPKTRFDDRMTAEYSTLAWKVANARSHKAAAVLFLQDSGFIQKKIGNTWGLLQLDLDELTQEIVRQKGKENQSPEAIESQRRRIADRLRTAMICDEKLRAAVDPPLSSEVGNEPMKDLDCGPPVFFCRRAAVNSWLHATTKFDLSAVEAQIDETGAPQSRLLTNCRLSGSLKVDPVSIEANNVIATHEGAGNLAEETVVLGAHYDGAGNPVGVWPRSEQQMLFPAADDNASGVAVMLEVARSIAQLNQTPRRRVVFIAFGGEECGTLGSSHYAHHALFPLEKTTAMINLDGVGQLSGDQLTARQSKPAIFDSLVGQFAPRHGLQSHPTVEVGGGSDSGAFSAEVLALWLVTADSAMHTPNDRPETLNYKGMRRISAFVTDMITSLATSPRGVGSAHIGDKQEGPNHRTVHDSKENGQLVRDGTSVIAAPLAAGKQTPIPGQKRDQGSPANQAAASEKAGEGNYLAVPLRTELQRLGKHRAGVDLFVLINGDAVAEDPNVLNAGALATTGIAKAMLNCKQRKKVSFCFCYTWTAKKNKEVMDSIALQRQGKEHQTTSSKQYLELALTELARRMGFAEVRWSSAFWDEGAKDWKSLVADITTSKEAAQEESAVGDEMVKIFPVRTALSRLFYSDANYVIWIVPWVERLKANDVKPMQQRIQRYVREAHMENRSKCFTICWVGAHADEESHAAFNKIIESRKLKELTGVGTYEAGGDFVPEDVK